MIFTAPFSCDNYINAGNYFQKQLSNHSNIAIRIALIFAKIVGRGQDVLIHASLGSIKLIASTAMAIYSIPAAAFDLVPTHHKVAKQASRHFGLALFFIADAPLSLANILKTYPQYLADEVQKKLGEEDLNERISVSYDMIQQTGKEMKTTPISKETQQVQWQNEQFLEQNKQLLDKNKQLQKQLKQKGQEYEYLSEEIQQLQWQNKQLREQLKQKGQEYEDLLRVYKTQEETMQIYDEIKKQNFKESKAS